MIQARFQQSNAYYSHSGQVNVNALPRVEEGPQDRNVLPANEAEGKRDPVHC